MKITVKPTIYIKDSPPPLLLDSEFKTVTGIEARRFGKTATHTISPIQLVAGDDRRIHHGINLAMDTIEALGRGKTGSGLLDLDFMAGFDWLDMAWIYLVLLKMGFKEETLSTGHSVEMWQEWKDNDCQPNFWKV